MLTNLSKIIKLMPSVILLLSFIGLPSVILMYMVKERYGEIFTKNGK